MDQHQDANGNRNYASVVRGDNLQLHETISLARRNSRRNVGNSRRNVGNSRRNIGNDQERARESDRETDDENPSRQRRENGRETDDKMEQENNILRDRIETLERERRQGYPVVPSHQKNGNEAQSTKGPGNNELAEMKTFLAEALKTISAFDKRLTTQMGSDQTHLDK